MAPEKESKVSKIAEHTIWHFTGQPFLEWITKEGLKPGISLLIGGPIGLFGHLTGVSIGWSVAISLESIGLIMLCWTLIGRRPKARSEVPATSPSTHDAPKILIEYRRSGLREDLEFFNDGPHSAMTFTLEPLVWQEKRYITLAHSIPPLAAKQRHVCQMFFEGSPSHGYPLVDYLREHTPKDARTTVNLIYSDHQNKRMFSREFSLETFGDGTLAWQPGEVKPLGPYGEPIK
jgi:hypothetical protein